MVVSRRIGREGEVVLLSARAKPVEHQTRLHAREAALGVEPKQLVEVLGAVDDQGHVAALTGQRRAGAARDDGRAVLSRGRHRLDHVAQRARDHHSDGHLAIVRGVGRVERAAAVVEAHLAAQPGLERPLQGPRVHLAASCRRPRSQPDQRL